MKQRLTDPFAIAAAVLTLLNGGQLIGWTGSAQQATTKETQLANLGPVLQHCHEVVDRCQERLLSCREHDHAP